MKKGQVFVRGLKADGSIGNIDILDLDEASFRAFVLEMLVRGGMVMSMNPSMVEGEEIKYRERV